MNDTEEIALLTLALELSSKTMEAALAEMRTAVAKNNALESENAALKAEVARLKSRREFEVIDKETGQECTSDYWFALAENGKIIRVYGFDYTNNLELRWKETTE